MKTKSCFVLVIVLSLLLLLVPACGDGNESPTTTLTSTVTLTTTPTATATKATATPNLAAVKVGAINAWSGPGAISGIAYGDPIIKLVEWQVKQQGGILGGREVKVVKFDDGTSLAQAVGGVKKLVLEEKVSTMVWGGISGDEQASVSDECENLKVLFVAVSSVNPNGVADKNFTVESLPGYRSLINGPVKLITEVLKPKRVALFITGGLEDKAKIRDEWRKGIEAAGIEVVYSEASAVGTIDFSPYLTNMKKSDPDVLMMNQDSEQSMSIAKQIMDLGGWGDIKVLGVSQSASASKLAGAQGWIIQTVWDPSSENPGSKKFLEDFKTVNGSLPQVNHVWFYISLWTVIRAVELAGTDEPVAVAQAARSGNLEFDTPLGPCHINSDGASDLNYVWVQIQDGKQVTYNP